MRSERKSFLVVVTGPPASGKDSVVEKLLEYRNLVLQRIVTYNTRAPRPGETHGVHYNFVSVGEFHNLRKKGLLLEHVRTGQSWKGTPKKPFGKIIKGQGNYAWRIDPSRSAILDKFFVKKFGTAEGSKLYEKTALFYVTVKNLKNLKQRFVARDSTQNVKGFYDRLEKDTAVFERHKDKFPHVIFNDESPELAASEILKTLRSKFKLQL